MTAPAKCVWCGEQRRQWSAWEQEQLQGGWARLCQPCFRIRLRNPFNALLPMRKITEGDADDRP